MASAVFIKDTGIVCLLLSGLVLPSVFVSGENATAATTASSTTAAPTMTTAFTMSNTTSAADLIMETTNSTTNQAASMSSSSSAATPTQSNMSTTYGGTIMSTAIQSPTTNSDPVSQSTHSPSTTSGGPTSHSTHSASSTSGGSSSSSTHSPSTTSGGSASHSSTSASSTSGGSSSSSTHSPSTTSGNMTEENKNATSNSSMEMINCPSFSCHYSHCYSKYNSQNESYCSTGESCQLLKSMDMWYNVSCSASCVEGCNNTAQPNCSVNCCNSTGCIKDIFVPMMMTTTVAATMTTNAPPTTRTTSTTANKGNKCHKGSCTGEDCYKNFKDLVICSPANPHCQLKKDTSGSSVVWTADCTNCTGYAPCTGTTNPCNLECCTATTTSCLLLNGTMNLPSFATRGPYLHIELIASLVCLLAITLLL